MLCVRTAGPLAAVVTLLLGVLPASAQDCKPDDIVQVIERTGQRLREISSDGEPRLREKLRELAKRNGWSETDAGSRGRAVIEDDQTRAMDARAADLLADLDRLADTWPTDGKTCERLEQARTKAAQLVEVTSERSAHVMARIEVALRPATAQVQQPPAPPPPPPPVVQQQPSAPTTQAQPQRQAAAPPRPKVAPPPPPAQWETRTVRDPESEVAAMAPPSAPIEPGSIGFSPDEIAAAGRGFFGTISAGLASVIDYAFQSYGRPTGYILGDEGGAAFLAGLRYGQGRLVTKQQGEHRVYWQGPSAGFDFGVAGSQVMYLVYELYDHEQLFQRFSGIDGSAYLVGGVGITFLKRGKVILAPIRTGIGLRVGASLGYVKFTPRPSYNPF